MTEETVQHLLTYVPNVPCGVERNPNPSSHSLNFSVPNVPCGVERSPFLGRLAELTVFLMYRVELKVSSLLFSASTTTSS